MRTTIFNIIILLCIYANISISQNKNLPIEYSYRQKFISNIKHSSLKPLNEKQHDITYSFVFSDTIHHENYFYKKLYQESFIQINEGDVFLSIDPLFNFSIGNKNQNYDYRYFENVRGLRVIGDLGANFSFETRIYENQFFYPEYINEIASERGVALGVGRSKGFKNYGHDAALASGYISFSPSNELNIQFGHGRHFFGNGYRSLLLSDYAPDYPYLSAQINFLDGLIAYKSVSAWMHSLDRRPVTSSSEALFKQKGALFNMLSIQPNDKIEISFFEGSIHETYEDSLGSISPNFSRYTPIFGVSSLMNTSRTTNIIYGINFSISPIKLLNIYSQFMLNSESKSGMQFGVKVLPDFKKIYSYLLLEYNFTEAFAYSMDSINYLQTYSHNAHELAHPLGSGFNEFIFKSYFEYNRFYVDLQFSAVRNQYNSDLSSLSSIFALSDITPVSYNERSWNYQATELGYKLNVKTKMKIYTRFSYRATDLNNEYYLFFGFSTFLNNKYYDL